MNDTIVLVGGCDLGEEINWWDDTKDFLFVGYVLWGLAKSVLVETLDFPDITEDVGIEIFQNYSIIDIHTLSTRKPDYIDWLRDKNFTKWMQQDFKFENVKRFPLEAILDNYNTRYFMSSFAYMMALAMYLGYKRIEIRRTSMQMDDDYIQKFNFEYWIGRAEQAGIEVDITEHCDLLKCGALYGYEADNTLAVYQQKYMGELNSRIVKGVTASIEKLGDVAAALKILHYERAKFMEEILNRHELEGPGSVSEDEFKAV